LGKFWALGGVLGALWPPSVGQDPKMSKKVPKMMPKWAQEASKAGQGAPRMSQNEPKELQRVPRCDPNEIKKRTWKHFMRVWLQKRNILRF